MNSSTYEVNHYHYSSRDQLFFDTNIWLLVYGPQYNPDDARVKTYSAALRTVLTAKCEIFIDVLVLSEFVNGWARFKYNTLPQNTHPSFKAFRNSPDFLGVAQAIATTIRKIIGLCTPVDSGFQSVDLTDLLSDFEKGTSDFNDLILARLCAARSFKLVTDDADFASQDVSILTANRRLLGR
jgi:hypothetical protein